MRLLFAHTDATTLLTEDRARSVPAGLDPSLDLQPAGAHRLGERLVVALVLVGVGHREVNDRTVEGVALAQVRGAPLTARRPSRAATARNARGDTRAPDVRRGRLIDDQDERVGAGDRRRQARQNALVGGAPAWTSTGAHTSRYRLPAPGHLSPTTGARRRRSGTSRAGASRPSLAPKQAASAAEGDWTSTSDGGWASASDGVRRAA